jgi:Ca-activated chloride channel family protein
LPPKDAVRIEEMINYFSYSYPQPKGDEPFSANIEVAGCPWNSQHRLVRIGLKGKEIAQDKRPPSNFVFLIDVSGSMSPSERLPLIKQALRMLVKRMTENDRIAIVVYASSSGVVLESTSCANKEKILEALDRLEAGGSTNGGEGVQRAYALAEENFIKGGVNRVILCTDGDFNVGITDQSELINLIQRKAKSGVFLSALGVGTSNYKDALMQNLADKGNGNYHYLDTLEEAQKVLIQQMNGTLITIAKDVKIQIEFNPAQVSSYRLIGYEKRILAAEDFNNDKKDAGEIGAGHTVTAFYEIVPVGSEKEEPRFVVDDLKYQSKPVAKPVKQREIIGDNKELLTLKLRYKKPDGDISKLSEFAVTDGGNKFNQASTDFKFAAAVAEFGMILKDSEHKGSADFGSVLELAQESKGDDKEGYRAEFINLVKKAKGLKRGED